MATITATIVQGAVWARLVAPPLVRMKVAATLEFEVPGARYMQKFKSGQWNGRISLVNRGTGMFPAGLADRVAALLRADGCATELQIAGGGMAERPREVRLVGIELRAYQRTVVEMALAAGRAFIMSPTGSGKTEMGAALVQALHRPTLWVCHRADLMRQTADRLAQRLGHAVGMIGDKVQDVQAVTVGMVPSLRGKLPPDWWTQWDVLILDECHHTSAMTWLDVSHAASRAFWRYGLSATPLTHNPLRDMQLEGATGPILVAETTDRLIEQGFLAKPRIVMLCPPISSYPSYESVREAVLPDWRLDPQRLEKMGGKLYAEAYRRGVTENEARTRLLAMTAVAHAQAGEKVLMLCTIIDHGTRLAQAMSGKSVGCWWLHGEDEPEARKQDLQTFREHRGGAIMLASTIFQEGVDIPEVDVLMLAGGGKSEMTTLQRVGRGLRPRPDKAEVLIYDVADGVSNQLKKDYLAQHSCERIRTYRAQGFNVEGVPRMLFGLK